MSSQYKTSLDVPTLVLSERLKELAKLVADGQVNHRDFSMRIPAELDRDADLVMNEAANRLIRQEKQIEISQSKQQTLRIWHVPQVPAEGDPFYVLVSSIDEAAKVISMLAQYDLYQYENSIKPDYANATGLQMLEDGEWCEWSDDNWSDIDDYMQNQESDQ